jgi:hypothetical protein
MSRTSMARAMIVVAAALVLAVITSAGAHAAPRAGTGGTGGTGLAAAMLDTGDLPAGFQPYASLTGPLDGKRAQVLGIDPSQFGSHEALVRAWLSPQRTAEVVETGVDAWTHDNAQADVAAETPDLLKQGLVRQPLPGPAHLTAYGAVGEVNGTRLFVLFLPLARGPYEFGLRVYTPASSAASAGSLMSAVAAAQVQKVPADTPDTEQGSDYVAGVAVGLLLGYLLIVDGIGYWRNPLRRKRGQARSTRPQAGSGIIDVSAAAKRNRRTAVWRLAIQFIGISFAAYGAVLGFTAYANGDLLAHFWYAYLVVGLIIVWAGGRFIRPAGVHRDHNRALLTGKHKVLVTGMLTVAAAMILLGLACALFAALDQALPQGSTVQLGPGQAPTPVQNVFSGLMVGAFVLVALGAIVFRSARRLGSIQARQLMLRDPRPPVLYLRSFGDDRLKLWTATFGRPSLIERFTPRRFDTFEEVLVRYLSGYGPVIAVNQPGTRLAPLGAARETIDSDDWKAAVATWMTQSRLIVFATPPSQVNEGLQWELEAVSGHGYWDKALIVVPPVRAEQLQARWRGLLGKGLWPFTVPGPVDDPHALVLALTNGQWQVISADRRSEWSYSAALEQALGDPRRLALPPPQHAPQPEPGRAPIQRRRVTLPIVALIVLLAAAASGLGSWYAVRSTPAAHQSVRVAALNPATSSPPASSSTTTSAPPSSPPPPPSAAAPSPSDTLVTLAPPAAGYPDAAAIQPVIAEYFRAINSRDYAGYLTTQSPGSAMTEQQFQSGFRSTVDSDVLVTSIATAPDGRPAADVTFTSRQQPQDGPSGESCTNWQVTMFFDPNAGTYTIGAPPADYRASYQAC